MDSRSKMFAWCRIYQEGVLKRTEIVFRYHRLPKTTDMLNMLDEEIRYLERYLQKKMEAIVSVVPIETIEVHGTITL